MRNTVDIKIEAEGRDKGKVFRITEMSASAAERWATFALNSAIRSGAPISEEMAQSGLDGVARMGMRALGGIGFNDLEYLLEEMMKCVQVVPDPSQPNVMRASGNMLESDIEEVSTRIKLRLEVWKLHTDFFLTGYLSKLKEEPKTTTE